MILRVMIVVLLVLVPALGQAGIKKPPKPVRQAMFGNSLWDHSLPVQPVVAPGASSIQYWMNQFANAAGYTYNFAGDFTGGSQLDGYATIPDGDMGLPTYGSVYFWPSPATNTLADVFGSNVVIAQNNYTWRGFTFDTADCTTLGTSSCDDEWLRWTNEFQNVQNPDGPIYWFVGVPEPQCPLYPCVGPEVAEFWGWLSDDGTGDYTEYFIDGHDFLIANAPDAKAKLMPVGPAQKKLTDPGGVLENTPWTDLFEDTAPHGTDDWYLLAAAVVYMVTYGEPVPDSYSVPAGIIDDIENNFETIVDTLWIDLTTNYRDANGDSRVFFESNPLPGFSIGMNLSGPSRFSSEYPLVNLIKSTGPNSMEEDGTPDDRPIALDPDGYPSSLLANQGIRIPFFGAFDVISHPAPLGDYRLTYDGDASTLFVAGSVSNVTYSPGQVDFTINGLGDIQYYGFTDGTHPRNMKLLRNDGGICSSDPLTKVNGSGDCSGDYVSFVSGSVLFNPEFLASAAKYEGFRFMDWAQTNCNPQTTWSTRPVDTDQSFEIKGMSLETMVALMNVFPDKWAWFNIPHGADDNYVTQMATLIESTKPPAADVFVELSNEVWNFGFTTGNACESNGQHTWALAEAAARGLAAVDIPYASAYGERAQEVFDLWRSAVSDSDDYFYVVGGQSDFYGVNQVVMAERDGWTEYDALALAPYFGYSAVNCDGVGNDLDETFAALTSDMNDVLTNVIPTARLDSDAQGLPLIAYEGGQHLQWLVDGGGDPIPCLDDTVIPAAMLDPRMRDLYVTYHSDWRDSIDTPFAAFGHISPIDVTGGGQYGIWGVQRSWTDTTSPRVSALVELISLPEPGFAVSVLALGALILLLKNR